MNDEIHVSSTVSALVMLAAIVGTYSVYTTYQDSQVADNLEDTQSSMEQTASALSALRLAKDAMTSAPTTTAASTTKTTASVDTSTSKANYDF